MGADICRVPYDKTEQWFGAAHAESGAIDWWLKIDGSVRSVKTCYSRIKTRASTLFFSISCRYVYSN